jgi:hypothetical protein
MTRDQTVIGVLGTIVVVAGAIVLGTGDVGLPSFLSSMSPQKMCSSREVEDTLHKLWVDTLSGVSMTSVLGIPASSLPNEAKALAPPSKTSEITFRSDPIAIQYNKDLQRVICQRQYTTTNGLVNMGMLVSGKSALTTNYSVQPGPSGGYIVSILAAPQD